MSEAAPCWRRCPDAASVQHICQAVRVDDSGALRCDTPGCGRRLEGHRVVRSRGTNQTDGRQTGQSVAAGVGGP